MMGYSAILNDTDFFPEWERKSEKQAFQILRSIDKKLEKFIVDGQVNKLHNYMKRREEISDYIVSHNLKLVFENLKNLELHGKEYGKALCEANCGLIQSVDDFHFAKLLKFRTYANRKIKRNVLSFLFMNQPEIQIDSPAIQLAFTICSISDCYFKEQHIRPSIHFIRENMRPELRTKIEKCVGEPQQERLALIRLFTNKNAEDDVVYLARPAKDILSDTLLEYESELIPLFLESFGLYGEPKSLEEISKKYGYPVEELRTLMKRYIEETETLIDKNLIME